MCGRRRRRRSGRRRLMANFYSDNPDLVARLDRLDLARVVALARGRLRAGARLRLRADATTRTRSTRTGARSRSSAASPPTSSSRAPRTSTAPAASSPRARSATPRASHESLERLRQADLMGITLPRRYGGLNFPVTVSVMIVEIVSRADPALMNIFGLQDIAETVNKFASDETEGAYLPRFASGEVTGSMALTEPEAGSDLQNVQLKATLGDDGVWRLNGVKRFITNGCGQISLVLARSRGGHDGRPRPLDVPLRARRAHEDPPPRGQARHPRLADLRAAVRRRAGAARRRAPARPDDLRHEPHERRPRWRSRRRRRASPRRPTGRRPSTPTNACSSARRSRRSPRWRPCWPT